MLTVIELFPSKVSRKPKRALAPHVVNLSRIQPTSEKRLRQLVLAQRRSREKSRQIKTLTSTIDAAAQEVVKMEQSLKQLVTKYHGSLEDKFVRYISMYQDINEISTLASMESDLFSDKVMCEGRCGRDLLRETCQRWFKGMHMTTQSLEKTIIGDDWSMILRIGIDTFHFTQTNPLHVKDTNLTASGWITAHFDGSEGRFVLVERELHWTLKIPCWPSVESKPHKMEPPSESFKHRVSFVLQ